MAQVGEFTKQGADIATECIMDIYKGLPKTRRPDYTGELNEALVFISNAKKYAPDGEKPVTGNELADALLPKENIQSATAQE